MTRRPRQRTPRGRTLVGERYEVDTGPVAHGGHVVARHEGRVLFVRHALPGERVTVEVTEGEEDSRFLRADAVEIHTPSPDRVEAPCPWAGPGLCGGCDFQHVALPAQRELKAAVVGEQLKRLAGIDVDVTVEAVPGERDGLGWRTRLQHAVDSDGRPGLRRHRSHDVVTVGRCLIGHPALPDVLGRRWPGASAVEAIVSSSGERLRIVQQGSDIVHDGPDVLHERAAGRVWEVTGSGFWQVHPGAADVLVEAVVGALAPQPGERVVDLYSGVGLFSGPIAALVGPTGSVVGVEGDRTAVEDARRNLVDLPQVSCVVDRVDRALRRGAAGDRVDLVVLDPPRTGARRPVVDAVAELGPRAVAYVACDPAALARDVSLFAERGYRLVGLRAFDLFPMTSHAECVALLEKTGSDLRRSDSR
ncbi:MAG: class I SAM-dependent RNA methyltransferase [Actinomycetes bacterium]